MVFGSAHSPPPLALPPIPKGRKNDPPDGGVRLGTASLWRKRGESKNPRIREPKDENPEALSMPSAEKERDSKFFRMPVRCHVEKRRREKRRRRIST